MIFVYYSYMKIANIYTTSKFESELYNITDKKENLIQGVPTLIIGWQNAKKLYPDVDILNWKIDENTYWTFGKRERRNEYEEKLDKFLELSVSMLDKTTVYRFINLLSETNDVKKALLSKISSDSKKAALKYYDMLYITESDYNVVYGISLRDIDYEGKDRNCVLNLIKGNSNIEYIEENECSVCNDIISIMQNKVYLATRIFV